MTLARPIAIAALLLAPTGSALAQGAPDEGGSAPPPSEAQPGTDRSVELFPDEALGSAVGWELRPTPVPDDETERSEEALDRFFDARLRDDQVQNGAVDGWYLVLGQQARRALRPDMGALERERRAGMDVPGIVIDELSRYARPPERPIDGGTAGAPVIFERTREGELGQAQIDALNPLHAPATWYRVQLRVVQDREGEIESVTILVSSGSPTLDRQAAEAIRAAAEGAPPPPRRVTGARDSIISDWELSVADVATFWNSLGIVTGDPDREVQGYGLGRGVVRTAVRLLRVTDAQHPSFEERREARRARRAPR